MKKLMHSLILMLAPVLAIAQTTQYQWSNGAATATINVTPPQTTVYYVTVTTATGTYIDSITVYVSEINISPTATSVSGCGAADGSITLNVTGFAPPFSFSWSNGATTKDIGSLPPGNYTVTATDDNGCTATATALVNAPSGSPPVAAFTYNLDGASVAFKNQSVNHTSYQWFFGDGSSSATEFDPTHIYGASGTYQACLHASNSCGSDTMCVTLVVTATGIRDALADEIKIYPNPAGSFLNIKFDAKEAEINIQSMEGKTMLREKISAKTAVLDIRSLARGMYVVEIIMGDFTIRKIFSKE